MTSANGETLTLQEAREVIRLAAKGGQHSEDIPTGTILRALCILVERIDKG